MEQQWCSGGRGYSNAAVRAAAVGVFSSGQRRPVEFSYRQTQVMFTFIVTGHNELCAGLNTAAP